jgi:hypothetical protein
MKESTFLKYFKRHCEIARDMKIFHKGDMLRAISHGVCPFVCYACKLSVDFSFAGFPKSCVRYGDQFYGKMKCSKLINSRTFEAAANYYAGWDYYNPRPTGKMKSILRKIRWR